MRSEKSPSFLSLLSPRNGHFRFESGHHSDLLELELTRRNIPFVKYGGLKFLESAHIKDVLAILRLLAGAQHVKGNVDSYGRAATAANRDHHPR